MSLRGSIRGALCAVVVLGMLTTPSGAATPAAVPAPAHTLAFGLDLHHAPHQSDQTAVVQAEAGLGRTLAFTRDFLLWDAPFPTSYENWLAARGTVPMISVKSRTSNGTAVPWASVAEALPGSALYLQMKSWADRVKAFGYPVYFTYNHEPEAATNNDLGTAADFVAAWRRMHDLFAAEGAVNARFMWIMTSWAFKVPRTDRRFGSDWYPGDAYIDGIAADAYNWSTCRYANGTWESLATVLSGFIAFGAQHPAIPLWLTEFATVESPSGPGPKARWIDDARALLTQPAYSQIVGVSYFDQLQPGSSCGWPMSSSTSATDALIAMAQDASFQATVATTAVPAAAIAYVGSSSTTANSTVESVRMPSGVSPGNGLVLISTDASPYPMSAPAGWIEVARASSSTMYTTVWQRVAQRSDVASTVNVDFGAVHKGSVELLAYSGTDAARPVRLAAAAVSDTAATTLVTPHLPAALTNERLVSYWAGRSSADSTLVAPAGLTLRSSETGTGGGRLTSASGDSDPTTAPGGSSAPGGLRATMMPAAGHSITWSLMLTPAA